MPLPFRSESIDADRSCSVFDHTHHPPLRPHPLLTQNTHPFPPPSHPPSSSTTSTLLLDHTHSTSATSTSSSTTNLPQPSHPLLLQHTHSFPRRRPLVMRRDSQEGVRLCSRCPSITGRQEGCVVHQKKILRSPVVHRLTSEARQSTGTSALCTALQGPATFPASSGDQFDLSCK